MSVAPNDSDVFSIFRLARERYLEGDFGAAQTLVAEYRNQVDYQELLRFDKRPVRAPTVSIVIVAWNSGYSLIECIESIYKQADDDFEVIVVDNGEDEALTNQLADREIAYVKMPMNVFPSEGRNAGSHFARGEYVVFVDDDAIVDNSYVAEIKLAFRSFEFAAIRGRIVSKTNASNNNFVGHYDMGPFPVPAILMTEGNAAVRRDVFREIGGFNPLVFGAEGIELTYRCQQSFPHLAIYYWPRLVVRHDYASGKRLVEKKLRHQQTRKYMEFAMPKAWELQRNYSDWYESIPVGSLFSDNRSTITKLSVFIRSGILFARRFITGKRN